MKFLKLLLISLVFYSCAESKMLQKSLNQYQVPLEYLFDSEINACDKSAKLAFRLHDSQTFDSATSVSKINHKVLPFLVYNYEEVNLGVRLGQSSLEQSYNDFFKSSFIVEAQRTGCFSLFDNLADSEYLVEITLDTCAVESKYQRSSMVLFFLLAYSMSFQELGFPAKTNLVLNAKLWRGDDLVFERQYAIDRIQPFIPVQVRDVNRLRADFVNNMAESLSLGTKDCIEQLIVDINQVIIVQHK